MAVTGLLACRPGRACGYSTSAPSAATYSTSLPPRPVQPQDLIVAARSVLVFHSLKRHRPIPGHSIAAVRALKSSLWATAGGREPDIRLTSYYLRRPPPSACAPGRQPTRRPLRWKWTSAAAGPIGACLARLSRVERGAIFSRQNVNFEPRTPSILFFFCVVQQRHLLMHLGTPGYAWGVVPGMLKCGLQHITNSFLCSVQLRHARQP